jgi:hypothetical protein
VSLLFCLVLQFFGLFANAQDSHLISGTITDFATGKPISNVTIRLKGSGVSAISGNDGRFHLRTYQSLDSLEITCVGFASLTLALQHDHQINIKVSMKQAANSLQEIVVGASRKPAKSFMQRVIENKSSNNPSRIRSYSYQSYSRIELDIDNISFSKASGKGLKSSMIKAYSQIDPGAKYDKELPIYFSERISNNYHALNPNINRENILAKKTLGMNTDKVIGRLEKFYFIFNVYDDWIAIFDQSYASPLNNNTFAYYNFFEGSTTVEHGDSLLQVQFTPKRSYERAFGGFLLINKRSLAVSTVNMYLNRRANINYVNDINYFEEYKTVFDSSSGSSPYMPYKISSEVKFESGLDLLGIPIPETNNGIKLMIRNTTVSSNIRINIKEPTVVSSRFVKREQTTSWSKPESFWSSQRSDSLTDHDKNIYKMVDTLKKNPRYQREQKLITFFASGYWDFADKLRLGPYSSFMSTNVIEGLRTRLSFWTMPGISKKLNFFGYGAYGTKDQRPKGQLGIKYIWNQPHWTKTSINYGSDYDLMSEESDELDNDNIISSLLRKPIPYTKIFIKKGMLKHEQYLSPNLSANGSVSFTQLDPNFDFKYRAINKASDKPFDSVYKKQLPFAEASIGLRYARKERTKIFNYDNLHLGTFSPVVSINYTYGFEHGSSQFEYQKVTIGVEQSLRLPPKSLLYYKLETGRVFGSVPYLLLNIPAGNEYYVASKYLFNTMAPYEFAADRYVSLKTRFHLGGALFDKIPLLQKLGWRERFSFNSYWGDMTSSNIEYNKGSNFGIANKTPFMEASAGIENIFHVLSIEYYRRLNYVDNVYSKKNGIFLGVYLVF